MQVRCPKCGESVEISGLGRKPLDIPVIIVCDTLREYLSVDLAAKELSCSRGYIFKVLKANGLKLKDVIKGG